jgi:NADP-dependent 3-hydroxy acid dehydrogenase YdfG
MRLRRIWELQREQHCWRGKFVRLLGLRLDVLVSNAGISKAATIKDHTVEDFDNLLQPMCAARSSWCSSSYPSSVKARTSL